MMLDGVASALWATGDAARDLPRSELAGVRMSYVLCALRILHLLLIFQSLTLCTLMCRIPSFMLPIVLYRAKELGGLN